MENFTFFRVLGVLLITSMASSVNGSHVQFFQEANFKGKKLDLNSSFNCINTQTEVRSLRGSVKVSACVVLYSKPDCSDVTDYSNGVRGYTHIVKSEEVNLSGVDFSYRGVVHQDFQVSSLRDCTEMEARPQVDLDFYEKSTFTGEITEIRDICTCTTLPTKSYANVWRSANTYGNCFTIYNNEGCSESSTWIDTTHAIRYINLYRDIYSIKPCYIPEHCIRFTATILNFEPASNISTFPVRILQIPNNNNSHILLNNNNVTMEQIYEVDIEINEKIQLEVPNAFKHLISINFTELYPHLLETAAPILEHSSATFRAAVMTELQNLRSNWNESSTTDVYNKTKILINEKLSLAPCTTNEVQGFVEINEIEMPYRLQINITGNLHESGEQLKANDVLQIFQNFGTLNNTADNSAIVEIIVKINLSFRSKSWINITQAPIADCRRREIALAATVIKLTPGDIYPNIQRHAITAKQIIENNETTQQEDYFEATRKMKEMAHLIFSKQFENMRNMTFAPGLPPGIDNSTIFISTAWAQLQIGLSGEFQNNLSSEGEYIFQVQQENEFRVERKISVSPCTSYAVNSFVEMAESVRIPYTIQLEITGQLENEIVEANEIQNLLEGMAIVRHKNNFTVVAETTANLTLTYGLASGIDISESLIAGCRDRFITYDASIINLEPLNDKDNSTITTQKFSVAPKLIFINNSTTKQEETFEASEEVVESANFEFSQDISRIGFIKMDDLVEDQLKQTIPFLSSVWPKLKGGFVPQPLNSTESMSFKVQNRNEFHVQKKIVQAPCMRYELSAFIEMAKDIELDYRVHLKVTGEFGSESVRAREIRGNLKDLTFLQDKDEYTVIAETTVKLKLNYVLATGVDNTGTQLLDCLEIETAFLDNCNFIQSGIHSLPTNGSFAGIDHALEQNVETIQRNTEKFESDSSEEFLTIPNMIAGSFGIVFLILIFFIAVLCLKYYFQNKTASNNVKVTRFPTVQWGTVKNS